MNPSRRRCVADRAPDGRQRAVAVVRPDEDDVRLGQRARRLEEVLDALFGRDPPDVEHDRGALGNDSRERIAVVGGRRLRECVPTDADARRVDAAGDDVVTLAR